MYADQTILATSSKLGIHKEQEEAVPVVQKDIISQSHIQFMRCNSNLQYWNQNGTGSLSAGDQLFPHLVKSGHIL